MIRQRFCECLSTVASRGAEAFPVVLIYNFISCGIKGRLVSPLFCSLVLRSRAMISAGCSSGGALIVSEDLHSSCAVPPCWCRLPVGTPAHPLCSAPCGSGGRTLRVGWLPGSSLPGSFWAVVTSRYLKYCKDGGWGRPRCLLPHPFGDKIDWIFF